MNALPSVTPATPSARTAPNGANASPISNALASDGGGEGFAEQLGRAQAPAKAAPTTTNPATPKGSGKAAAKPGSNVDADRHVTPAKAAGAEHERPVQTDEARAEEHDAPLPGWPGLATPLSPGVALATPATAVIALPVVEAASEDGTNEAAGPGIAGRTLRAGGESPRGAQGPLPGSNPDRTPAARATQASEPRLTAAGAEPMTAATVAQSADQPLPAALPPPPLPAVLAQAHTAATPAPAFEGRIAVPLDSTAFAPALATQISWLAQEGVQQARLSLNPVETGPLMVKIVVEGSQARIDFSADIAATRSAIEASLPALAAALHDSGLTLAGGGVFDGQARDGSQADRQPRPTPAGTGRHGSAAIDGLAAPAPVRAARGLVDLVA